MKTAWEEIKGEITKGQRPGTIKYLHSLYVGGQIFIRLLPHLKNQEKEEKAYNDDAEVTEALMNLRSIKEIMGVTG